MPLPERICEVCGKPYIPRRSDQKNCNSKCARRKNHHPEADHKIVHVTKLEDKADSGADQYLVNVAYIMYEFTVLYHRFNSGRGMIFIPKQLRVRGTPFNSPSIGTRRIHKFLQPMIERWITENLDKNTHELILTPERKEKRRLQKFVEYKHERDCELTAEQIRECAKVEKPELAEVPLVRFEKALKYALNCHRRCNKRWCSQLAPKKETETIRMNIKVPDAIPAY